MRIRFWGTRGSLARPGPATLRYGGNTSCVEANGPDGTLIVLDCGTGAYDLGQHLVAARPAPHPGPPPDQPHALGPHPGLPLLRAAVRPGQRVGRLRAERAVGQQLEETLAGQMEYAYFPVTLGQLGATIRYHDLGEGAFDAGRASTSPPDISITPGSRSATASRRTAPPSCTRPTTSRTRRIRAAGRQHRRRGAPRGPAAHRVPRGRRARDPRRAVHARGVPAEDDLGTQPGRAGGGLRAGRRAERLALFHHDPLRTDDARGAARRSAARGWPTPEARSTCSPPSRAR